MLSKANARYIPLPPSEGGLVSALPSSRGDLNIGLYQHVKERREIKKLPQPRRFVITGAKVGGYSLTHLIRI